MSCGLVSVLIPENSFIFNLENCLPWLDFNYAVFWIKVGTAFVPVNNTCSTPFYPSWKPHPLFL
ncbi:hypothetical protein PGB90_004942 [Kerria lacca]